MTEQPIEAALEKGRAIASRLYTELEMANASWAHLTALHRAHSNPQTGLKYALSKLYLTPRLTSLADALIRDTLLALFRITDDPSKNRQTLCAVSKLLSSPSLQGERIRWFEELPIPSGDLCKEQIHLVRSLVPSGWAPKPSLESERLLAFREQLRPIRDRLLAHAAPFERIQFALHAVEDFRKLTGQLVIAARFIFEGAAGLDTFEA
jgi:hypothetical protein